jgi:hypothetical protein
VCVGQSYRGGGGGREQEAGETRAGYTHTHTPTHARTRAGTHTHTHTHTRLTLRDTNHRHAKTYLVPNTSKGLEAWLSVRPGQANKGLHGQAQDSLAYILSLPVWSLGST